MPVVDGYGLEQIAGYVAELGQPCELLLQRRVLGNFCVAQYRRVGLVRPRVPYEDGDLYTVARATAEHLRALPAELFTALVGIPAQVDHMYGSELIAECRPHARE